MRTSFGTRAIATGVAMSAALPVHAFQIDIALTDDCH